MPTINNLQLFIQQTPSIYVVVNSAQTQVLSFFRIVVLYTAYPIIRELRKRHTTGLYGSFRMEFLDSMYDTPLILVVVPI